MAVLNNLKLSSSGDEEPETFIGFCKVFLQELLIFLICFSVSALIFVLFFSAFNGLTAQELKRRPRSPECRWPREWCRFFDNKQHFRDEVQSSTSENNFSFELSDYKGTMK